MSFKSLDGILNSLAEQRVWQEQPFQLLLKYWPDVVGVTVAAHTRPVSIQRKILWVATSSAVWAQELSFSRQRILEKLNGQLPSPLLDIRFSTAGWQHSQNSSPAANSQAKTSLSRDHPSYVMDAPNMPKNSKSSENSPNAVFQHWAKVMQARSHDLPLCPQCRCPTPPGEIQRWAMCSICAAKQPSVLLGSE
jgi:predicted nucleic acid-binding Zn ribbon protein